ncbi:MAG: DUF4825 domain-containing protein, partial [Oscillospiraceae bacterium]|nr:DUF4825 domain-containing protein [Oscillospiraceae bacterium]
KAAFLLFIVSLLAIILITRFLISDQNSDVNDQIIAGKNSGSTLEYNVDFLLENKTEYIGNHVKVGALNRCLPLPENLTRGILKLSTEKPPYKATYHYHLINDSKGINEDGLLYNNEERFLKNSILLFALIDNADEISHLGYWNNKALSSLPFFYTYTRADAERVVGLDVRQFAISKEKLAELIEIVENLKADDLGVAINSTNWWKSRYPVIKDLKFYVLKNEYLETADENNPDLSLLVREYICLDGTVEEWNQVYSKTNNIALPKSDRITTALDFKNELIKREAKSSLQLPSNTIISNYVLNQWIEEKYSTVFEYSDESPHGLTYEKLNPLLK